MSAAASQLRVLVVGRGKVAHGLDRAVRAGEGLAVCRLRASSALRDADLRWAELVLLAVPDSVIRTTAEGLAARVAPTLPVLHLSGNRPVSETSACREHGALHPLASFASAQHPPSLSGAGFALAGTPRALRMGKRFVRAVGGKELRAARAGKLGRSAPAPLQGPAYHAAAALVANGGAALAASGVDILLRLGLDATSAQQGIAGLLRTVADNVERVGVPKALTGPIVRGDAATVAEHRAALHALEGPALGTYDAIAEAVLACAIEAGLTPDAASEVQRVLRSKPGKRSRGRRAAH